MILQGGRVDFRELIEHVLQQIRRIFNELRRIIRSSELAQNPHERGSSILILN